MKHVPIQKSADATGHSSRPFFSKRGEGSYLTAFQGSEQPFFSPTVHQAKLNNAQPNDKYEQEADSVADHIVENQNSSSSENGGENHTGEGTVQTTSETNSIQRALDISTSSHFTIQRQVSGAASSGGSLNEEYLELICEVVDDIQGGVLEGRTWEFEREMLLQGDEELNANSATPNLIAQRREVLRQIVSSLHQLAESISSGAVVPTDAASRRNLGSLWLNQGYDLNSTRAWSRNVPEGDIPPDRRRDSEGELLAWTYSPAWYIGLSPGSPQRMLQPANISPWWEGAVSACEVASNEPVANESTNNPVLSSSLGDAVIYLTGVDRDRWDWEPRGSERSSELGRTYNWHQDELGRVYILVDDQVNYLLQGGRLTTNVPEVVEAENRGIENW